MEGYENAAAEEMYQDAQNTFETQIAGDPTTNISGAGDSGAPKMGLSKNPADDDERYVNYTGRHFLDKIIRYFSLSNDC